DYSELILSRLNREGIAPSQEEIDKINPKRCILLVETRNQDTVNMLKKEMLFHGGSAYYRDGKGLLLSGRQDSFGLLAESMEGAGGEVSEVALEIRDSIVKYSRKNFVLGGRGFSLDLSARTHIMGILNVTPDSFSDGGLFVEEEKAVTHAKKMVEEGADIIDIGGESTRPGAKPVAVEEEIRRVIPLIERLSNEIDVPISIDTYKSEVATAALEAGARIINDISGLRFDQEMAGLAAEKEVPVIIMHMKGTPQEMQDAPSYDSVMGEIYSFLKERIDYAISAGIKHEKIVIDPGIGFGKKVSDNLVILDAIDELRGLGCPMLLGTSRKSFIGKILDLREGERVEGTAATVAAGILKGIHILRVHDVGSMVQVARMIDAIKNNSRHEHGS
ncbi:MAG: dihydropteroate synthase, partial [Nitrospirota bacterium]